MDKISKNYEVDGYSQKLFYSNFIKSNCEKQKITISQLALLTGLDEAHIDKIWNAEIKPSNAVLGKIALALEIPYDTFFC